MQYLVGTPKGRLTKLAAALAEREWQQVRPAWGVKLLPHDGELYVLAHSAACAGKERGMRQRKLKAYWKRLGELAAQGCALDELLQKLGAARDRDGRWPPGWCR